jgi:hypothetical protein
MIELTFFHNGGKFDVNPTHIQIITEDQRMYLKGDDEIYKIQESRELIRKMVKLWYRECFGATVNNVMERKM